MGGGNLGGVSAELSLLKGLYILACVYVSEGRENWRRVHVVQIVRREELFVLCSTRVSWKKMSDHTNFLLS